MSLLTVMDILGTIAFSISGTITGIKTHMDIFGVTILGIVTATAGGVIRDLITGIFPPAIFIHPRYFFIAVITSILTFLFIYIKKQSNRPVPEKMKNLASKVLFMLDTLGLAAFTLDGIITGISAGYADNCFFLIVLGVITGVGGGVLCDILAAQTPFVFRKHIYAMASIIGGMVSCLIFPLFPDDSTDYALVIGFIIITLIRCMASHFKWNLPYI